MRTSHAIASRTQLWTISTAYTTWHPSLTFVMGCLTCRIHEHMSAMIMVRPLPPPDVAVGRDAITTSVVDVSSSAADVADVGDGTGDVTDDVGVVVTVMGGCRAVTGAKGVVLLDAAGSWIQSRSFCVEAST